MIVTVIWENYYIFIVAYNTGRSILLLSKKFIAAVSVQSFSIISYFNMKLKKGYLPDPFKVQQKGKLVLMFSI